MVAERGRPRLAQHIVDVLVPLITEEIVKVVKTVLQEQISERICQQIDDVFVSQVVEQVTGLARERQNMGQEDSNSQRRRAWEKIWDPRALVLSPFSCSWKLSPDVSLDVELTA